jgi:hypothetical protein
MKLSVLVLSLLLVASSSFAADVDGKWSGSIDTPAGTAMVEFTFRADGATLTGTTSGPNASNVPIKEGQIRGDKIAFSVELNVGGTPLTVAYTGIVSTAQIKLTANVADMPIEFVVKKSEK